MNIVHNTISDTIIGKKISETHFNAFLKSLPTAEKKMFLDKILTHRLIFASPDKEVNRQKMDNWRYIGKAQPSHSTKIIIFLIALGIKKDVEIKDLFPELEQEYIDILLPILRQFYNNLARGKDPLSH